MSQMAGIELGLDAGQYMGVSQQVLQQNQQLVGSMSQLAQANSAMGRSWAGAAPSQDHIGRLKSWAQAAEQSQAMTNQLSAAQAAGGANAAKLATGIRQLAIAMPIGQQGAQAIVGTMAQLGLGGQGAEKRILSLSKTVGQLQGAVGGNGPQLGSGLVQLERTFGDQGVDPKRVRATADALTTVATQTGASASNILDFTNLIGPFAQAAGIGKTSALGIAAGFSRIGQDGSYAANTVGTLLQGINTAVTQGSPDLAKYANILGTTAGHFQTMFKANPTQTLVGITQALAQNTPAAQSQLQGLGLDSVRSQRSLQALIQSGGLQQSINTAVGGYNSGSTSRAASAAYGGVIDSYSKVAAAGESLAQTLGQPLIGPLTFFAKTLSGVTGGLANMVGGIVGSGPGKVAANVGLGLVGAGLIARRVAGPLGRAGLAGAVFGSQPVRAGLAGFATGRAEGDTMEERVGNARRSFIGRIATFNTRPGTPTPFDRQLDRRDQRYFTNNWRGETVLRGGMAQSAFETGAGLGSTMAGFAGPRGGPGFFRQLGRVATVPFEAAQLAFRTSADTARQGRLAMQGRSNEMYGGDGVARPGAFTYARGAYRTAGMGIQDAWRGAGGLRGLFTGGAGDFAKSTQGALKGLDDELVRSGGLFGSMRNAGSAFTRSLIEQTRLLGATGGVVGAVGRAGARGVAGMFSRGTVNAEGEVVERAGLAVRGLRGVGGMLGGPAGIAATAAMAGIGFGTWAYRQSKGNADYERGVAKNYDMYANINAYREASGQATLTNPSVTGASNATLTTATTPKGGTTPPRGGFKVSDSDIAAANATRSKVITPYKRNLSPGQLASQINSLNTQGLTSTDADSVMTDLLRQGYSRDTINKAMKQVKPMDAGNAPAAVPTGDVAGRGPAADLVGQGARTNVKIRMAPDKWRISEGETKGLTGDIAGMRLAGTAQTNLNQISSIVGQTEANQQGQYGTGYAQQEEFRSMNKLFAESGKKGNAFFTKMLGRRFSQMLTGKQYGIDASTASLDGGYIEALAKRDPQFAQTLKDFQKGGGTLDTGGLAAKPTLSPAGQQMQQILGKNNVLASMYDNTKLFTGGNPGDLGGMAAGGQAMNAARSATMASLQQPDNVALQGIAVQKQLNTTGSSASKLNDLAVAASKAAATIGDTSSAAYKLSTALQAAAEQRMATQAPFQTSGQQLGAQFTYGTGLVNANQGINSDAGKANTQKGEAAQGASIDQAQNQMKQYLMAEFSYQTQRKRAVDDNNTQVARANQAFQIQQEQALEDYNRSRAYSQQDYFTSTLRAERDFNIQMQRSEQDYELQVARAKQDFNTQLSRQQRDYNIQMARGQQDYLTQQGRAIRDFNIQLKREVEDQAQALYSPYQRIQTQSVWDTKNLLANMASQNTAIKKQSDQLNQVRKMGITDQTIQTLGLNNPTNAQELNQMVSDMLNDPSLVKQVNQSAAARMTLGSILVTDPSNKDIARAKADFATQMGDMEADYRKSVARARADMAKSVADEEADFGRSLTRMAQDNNTTLRRARQDFNTTLMDAAHDENVALSRMDTEFAISVQRATQQFGIQMGQMAHDYELGLSRMREDTTNSELELTGKFADIWNAVQKTMHGQQVNWQTLMKSGLNDTLRFINTNSGAFSKAYQNLVGGDISSLFPKGAGGTGGPKGFADPFAKLFSSLNAGGGLGGQPWPVSDPTVTQEYGHNGHPGIDLAVPRGTPIHAALGGTVVLAGWNDGYGNCVILDHGGGRTTLYGHQEKIGVSPGQAVQGGQVIGWVDSTGNSTGDHLHFETRQDGHTEDPRTTLPVWEATAGKPGKPKVYEGPFAYLINTAEALTLEAQQKRALSQGLTSPGNGIVSGPQSGPLQSYAKTLLNKYGWGGQWPAFDAIEMQEAGWQVNATNPSSGAYGLAQALPPSKYGQAGADWRTNGYTQLDWMMAYIGNRLPGGNPGFHDPNSAEQFHLAHGWYGDGSVFTKPTVIGVGERGTEAVIPLNQQGVSVMAEAMKRAIGPDDIRAMLVAGHGSPITYHYETHTTDAGIHLEGPVTVQASDPAELAAQLDAKRRADNLVPTGRPRS